MNLGISNSKGRWTTRILALADAVGDVARFVPTLANRHDTVGAAPLIEARAFGAMLADRGFDGNWIIDEMRERGAKFVLSQRPQRRESLGIDRDM